MNPCKRSSNNHRTSCEEISTINVRIPQVTKMHTVKPGLQSRVFTCATFAIIFVDDQCPWLSPSFKSFRNTGDGILLGLRGTMVVVESDVHVSTFVIDSLDSS